MAVEMIDHTADLGLQVTAPDLPQLFAAVALAMRDLMVSASPSPRSSEHLALHVTANDWSELMLDWLRELLYLWHSRKQLLQAVQIQHLSPFELKVRVELEIYDADRHILEHELKAVTWHQFDVQKTPEGWCCRVIFDV